MVAALSNHDHHRINRNSPNYLAPDGSWDHAHLSVTLSDSMFSVRRIIGNDWGSPSLSKWSQQRASLEIDYTAYGQPDPIVGLATDPWTDFPASGSTSGDGVIDFFDMQSFLALYSAQDIKADRNADGIWNIFDVTAYSADFAAGSQPLTPTGREDEEENPFGLAGYRHDRITGLYHVRNRVLDPEQGKWLTRDPAGFVDGRNVYLYAGSTPIWLVDPMGLRGGTPPKAPTVTYTQGTTDAWSPNRSKLNIGYDSLGFSDLRDQVKWQDALDLARNAANGWPVWPEAKRNLLHFLNDDGSALPLNVITLVETDLASAVAYKTARTAAISYVSGLKLGSHYFTSETGWQTTPATNRWWFAMGTHAEWAKGRAVVSCDSGGGRHYQMVFIYKAGDIYDWHPGLKATPGGINVKDALLNGFMKRGMAQDFIIYPKPVLVEVVKWSDNEEASDPQYGRNAKQDR